MILIEFIKFIRRGFRVYEYKFRKDLIVINNIVLRHRKAFTFKNYWNTYIFYKEITILNKILTIVSLLFFFKMIYHFVMYYIYTIDIYITHAIKHVLLAAIFILEQWEKYMYMCIQKYKKDIKKEGRYKKEYAVWSYSKAKMFERVLKVVSIDLNKSLDFKLRNHSVLLKYFRYWYEFFRFLYKWIISNIKYFSRTWYWRIRIKISRYRSEKSYRWGKMLRQGKYKLLFKDIIEELIKFYKNNEKIWEFKFYLKKKWNTISFFLNTLNYILFTKVWVFLKIYKWKKEANNEIYFYLYNYYYIFLKKKTLFEKFYYKDMFKEEDADDIIIHSFVFKIINFRILYFIHRRIKPIPYFVFLEQTFDVVKKRDIKYLKIIRDAKPVRIRIILFLLKNISKLCLYINPYVKKYYPKVIFFIKLVLKQILFYIYLIFKFIISLPKFLIVYPYVPLKENLRFFFKFIKTLFRNK